MLLSGRPFSLYRSGQTVRVGRQSLWSMATSDVSCWWVCLLRTSLSRCARAQQVLQVFLRNRPLSGKESAGITLSPRCVTSRHTRKSWSASGNSSWRSSMIRRLVLPMAATLTMEPTHIGPESFGGLLPPLFCNGLDNAVDGIALATCLPVISSFGFSPKFFILRTQIRHTIHERS